MNEQLQNQSNVYLAQGYEIKSQTETSITMQKEKEFKWGLFIGLLILFGAGIIYLIYYFINRYETLTLTLIGNEVKTFKK